MKILEYDQVDPLKAMYVARLALDFAFTPEYAAHLRQADPRPFPCLAIYAVEDNDVLGQVGIFRLPMISTEGREDVGGVWAVSTHPQFSGQGVASVLLDEAHRRMREAGLRFSTLGTNRFRVAYNLYRQKGYQETNVLATAMARWETAHRLTHLSAQVAGPDGHDIAEDIFADIARDYLGFAWRYRPFEPLRKVDPAEIWILRDSKSVVGYALTKANPTILFITNLLLLPEIDVADVVAAITEEAEAGYVEVKISRPVEIASLRRAGFHVANPTWGSFMVKPLTPGLTYADACRAFGIGTDRFLISWMDTT
jgi:GNAT superfamily N-acetyltransferase